MVGLNGGTVGLDDALKAGAVDIAAQIDIVDDAVGFFVKTVEGDALITLFCRPAGVL